MSVLVYLVSRWLLFTLDKAEHYSLVMKGYMFN